MSDLPRSVVRGDIVTQLCHVCDPERESRLSVRQVLSGTLVLECPRCSVISHVKPESVVRYIAPSLKPAAKPKGKARKAQRR
jgi:hypothetical protein